MTDEVINILSGVFEKSLPTFRCANLRFVIFDMLIVTNKFVRLQVLTAAGMK
jgi:hypothetical protein